MSKKKDDDLAAAHRELDREGPARRRYDSEVRAAMEEYDRSVAPAHKRYQKAVALIEKEMRDDYNKASTQQRKPMLEAFQQRKDQLWQVFVRETADMEGAKRTRIEQASIRYNSSY